MLISNVASFTDQAMRVISKSVLSFNVFCVLLDTHINEHKTRLYNKTILNINFILKD